MESRSNEVRRVADEVRARLASKGIHFDARENPESLMRAEEAVEEFEQAVESRGGDLMMDEGVADGATEPDDVHFALPVTQAHESVAAYLDRLAVATAKVRRHRPRS